MPKPIPPTAATAGESETIAGVDWRGGLGEDRPPGFVSERAESPRRWSPTTKGTARDVVGRFDRIVSVGTFGHVGLGFYETYFRKCADLLAGDGFMVLHSIGPVGRSEYHQ